MSDYVYRRPYRRPVPLRSRWLPQPAAAGPVLLEDDFNDNSRDTAKWTLGSVAFENAGVGVAEANQQVEITPLSLEPNPAIYGYKSANTYDFTAREASVKIIAIPTDTEAWLVVALDVDNYFRIWVAGGNIQTRSRVAASNTNQSHGTFNLATHTYWRIRHDATPDEIVWEYSSNGSTWTELRRLARPITITAVSVYLSGGTGASVTSPGIVKFDDFNLRTPVVTSDVTIGLTGVSSSTSAGTLGVGRDTALTGSSVTSSTGSLAPTRLIALSGNLATSAVGLVAPTATVALTGQSATASVGSLTTSRTVSVSGNSATSAVGTLTPVIGVTVALTGVSATASAGSVGSSRSTALTGVSATSAVGTVTPTLTVTVALTGVQAIASVGTLAPTMSKALTGMSATSLAGILSPQRAITLAGVAAILATGLLEPSRTVSLTGVSATSAVGTIAILAPEDALSVSKNIGTGVLFTTHVGTGTLRTGDARTMTLTTTNTSARSIVYQDTRTDT